MDTITLAMAKAFTRRKIEEAGLPGGGSGGEVNLTPEQIEEILEAVKLKHTHENQSILDQITEEVLREEVPRTYVLPETAEEGDLCLYAPQNTFTLADSGKRIYIDWEEFGKPVGEDEYTHFNVACYNHSTDVVSLEMDLYRDTETCHLNILRMFNSYEMDGFDLSFAAGELDTENSNYGDKEGVQTFFNSIDELPRYIDIPEFDQIDGSGLEDGNAYLFHTEYRLMKYQGGEWVEAVEVPTKTSELENDSGFITAEDIPQGELSQFIEQTASSANLYPPMVDGWTDNASIMSDGTENPGKTAYCITPQITVKPETTYTIKPLPWGMVADANKGRCYDEQGNPLAQVTWTINGDSATFTTPANTAYVRFSVFKTDFDNLPTSDRNDINLIIPIFNNTFMLVEGTTAPEKYEPYGQGKYRLKDIEIPLKSVNLENVNDKALPIFAPLAGKKIANFGDSIFGNARPPEDVSTYLAEKTGAEVLNCAFGGCRMAIHNQLGHWNAFTMVNLAQAIASGDYSVQDEALNYDDRTSYAEQPLSVIKVTDFSTVDILTIAYGTNDFTSNIPLDNSENPYDTATLAGALRTSVESLLITYPNLKIFVLSTMYRFYIDENNEFTEDSNTKVNSIGLKLGDYNAKLKEVAEEYNLPYVDDYNIGIGKFNRYQYFNVNDGAHHKETGRRLIAEHLAKQLY